MPVTPLPTPRCARHPLACPQDDESLAKLGLRCFELLARRLAQPSNASSWGRLLARVVVLLRQELQALLDPAAWAVGGTRGQGRAQVPIKGQGAATAGEGDRDGAAGAAEAGLPGGVQRPSLEAVAQPAAVAKGKASVAPVLRARLLLLMQRLLVALQEGCMARMPWRVQAPLAGALVEAAQKLQAFNCAQEAAAAAARRRDVATLLAHQLPHLHLAYGGIGATHSEAPVSGGGAGRVGQEGTAEATSGGGGLPRTPKVVDRSARASSEAAPMRPGMEDDVQSRGSETLADSILEATTTWVPPGESRLSASSAGAAANVAIRGSATGMVAAPASGAEAAAGRAGAGPGSSGGDATAEAGAPQPVAAVGPQEGRPSSDQAVQASSDHAVAGVHAHALGAHGSNNHHHGTSRRHPRGSSPAAVDVWLAGVGDRGSGAVRTPLLALTSAESQDAPVLCLGRLESEAAAGALSVLCHCIDMEQQQAQQQQGPGAGAEAGADRATDKSNVAATVSAEQMLRSFCLHLIATAAEAARGQSGAGAEHHDHAAAASADSSAFERSGGRSGGGAGTAAAAPHDAEAVMGPRDGPSSLEPWHAALRAANVASAIQLYLHLPAKPGTDSTVDLWQYMVALVGSPHAAVRQAVAEYFLTRVAVKLGLGPAANLSL